MHWNNITLIGLGLLGGSLGLAIKKQALARRVTGYVRRESSIAEAQHRGVVDKATCDLHAAVEGADLVVLCTPIAQMKDLAMHFSSVLKEGAVVTDVGSVKTSVLEDLEPIISQAGGYFVGSHPMAGAEKTGLVAARPDLFHHALCLVTPGLKTNPDAAANVANFWRALEMRVLKLTPELHDDLVSRCSHLPHVVAAELANYVLSPAHPREQAMLCATGFRDTTRIASGSPEMWRDIALANGKNLSRVLGVFIEDLQEFRLALDNQDLAAIEEFFSQAKSRRDRWSSQTASHSPE